MSVTELIQLPLAQRLHAMEALWASLTQDEFASVETDWHAEILADRVKEIESGNTLDWETAKAQLFAMAQARQLR